MQEIADLFNLIPALKTGQMGAAGALIMLVVRIYRMIPGAPWPKEKWQWVVQLVVFILSFVASMLVGALAGGIGWGAAAAAAFGVAATAITGHEVTKSLGAALRAPVPKGYVPSPFRDAASLVLPPPTLKDHGE